MKWLEVSIIVIALTLSIGLISCGSDGGSSSGGSWCPGTVCSNCASDPACNVTCSSGTPTCVGGSYFGADPNLRCAFCS